ncbi:MAG: excinuclease ABC subunit UvrA [Thermoguttaceae bacterium]|nr:excinuclease ABC subunit UvrA [Thermoguttaceae bacterium]
MTRKTPPSEANSREAGQSASLSPSIRVAGARVHNLKNISLSLPRNKITVITGPSGSGKSSLAYDTIFAEGQRQYVESLSDYSRQFLHQLERPDVDLITGLQPTISIDQRFGTRNPRSTTATLTEIYDYLRILYARLGLAHCYQCGDPIRQQTPEEILQTILSLPEGTRVMLLAPMVKNEKGDHADLLKQIAKTGNVRVFVDGQIAELEQLGPLDPNQPHTIQTVIDRLIIRESVRTRLFESLKLALKTGAGLANCLYEKSRTTTDEGKTRSVWKELLFSTLYLCPRCRIHYTELQPRTFSFNSPYGVCPVCFGVGRLYEFDPDLVIAARSLSLAEGAFLPMKFASAASKKKYGELFCAFERRTGIGETVPIDQWGEEALELFFYGDPHLPEEAGPDEIPVDLLDSSDEEDAEEEFTRPKAIPSAKEKTAKGKGKRASQPEIGPDGFPGIFSVLESVCETTRSKKEQENLAAMRAEVVCRACGGARIRPEARSVTVAGKHINEVTAMTVDDALAWFESLSFPEEQKPVAEPLIGQIRERLDFMQRVGLGYLTLDRAADTLSGGELQRVRLAAGLGNGLVGVCYILDEPSVGLHPRDNIRLINAMRALQRRGNTVLVVEHNEAIMRAADWLVDLGPGAGDRGGEILAEGTPDDVAAEGESPTGKYLGGIESIPIPARRRKTVKSRSLVIDGVTTNNLKNITVSFPLGTFICITGVSGSGKSSLITETLVPALSRRLTGAGPKPGGHKGLRGASQIDKLIVIDQSPIGRSPRSNPATFSGLFDEIRKVFAASKDARRLGFKAGRFSFNVPGGRCEACQGQGIRKIEMHFLPDMYAVCPECGGTRFNRQTLEVKYKGKSIADVLDMQVDQAADFFENHQTIMRLLEGMQKVGLGYLPLGQASTTLSGGEAQRIKLAAELSRVETGSTLYILDEPTSGLHAGDIRKLLEVLSHLVDQGNTVIVIEHNLDVVKTADWIIDLGVDGGENGGYLTAVGTPEQVAQIKDNYTGRYLREVLEIGGKGNGEPAETRKPANG